MERFKRFLGCGWNFPVGTDQQGGIAMSWHEENIAQNIEIILGTAPGERQMRPEFGCNIHDLVFKPNNRITANLAEHFARVAIIKWEPRVDNVEVKADPDPYEENKLRLEISYTIRTTNTTRNLVYPFYLEEREEEA
ncbi:MAG: GPW/gp25 family protein [Bradymonadales bacterium]|nr:GPW/gp25 family protein [Bradymonadales bacterium]